MYAAVSNIAALFGHGGNSKSRLCQVFEKAQIVKDKPGNLPSFTRPSDSEVNNINLSESEASAAFISYPSRLASAILAIILKHTQD